MLGWVGVRSGIIEERKRRRKQKNKSDDAVPPAKAIIMVSCNYNQHTPAPPERQGAGRAGKAPHCLVEFCVVGGARTAPNTGSARRHHLPGHPICNINKNMLNMLIVRWNYWLLPLRYYCLFFI